MSAVRAWLNRWFPVGTRSVLFGAHQCFLHPWFVAWAWWQLYGFPWDPRLWVAFFVHDLGYFGKPNMDGDEGETHPEFGARIMGRLFGDEWYAFTLLHSRFYSKRLNRPFSRLCVADKLGVVLMPWWLYLPLTYLTGEVYEYMAGQGGRTAGNGHRYREWNREVCNYLRAWVEAHRDGREDTWTQTHGMTNEDRGRVASR